MFWFKKIVSQFLFPLPVSLFLALLGLGLLWFTKRQRAGRILVTLGVALVLVLSYGAVSCRLLAPLETQYATYDLAYAAGDQPTPQFVVVLGGGHNTDPRLPVTSQLSAATLTRLVEGIRLYRQYPESKLILSGGTVFDPVPEAETMAHLAADLGVDRQDVILESDSRDTEDEVRLIHDLVGDAPFILVTSASHMPRSMALFEAAGMSPYAAPTEHQVKGSQGASPGQFFPSAWDFYKAERAAYEYMGLAWAWLRGRL
jgi:uncharacterized SAM-binding protein YcdF (DUF218 family)